MDQAQVAPAFVVLHENVDEYAQCSDDDQPSSANLNLLQHRVLDNSPRSDASLLTPSTPSQKQGGWPEGSANQLKLSVGGDDDDNDDCEESEMNEADQLRARMREWHQSCGPARNDFENDFADRPSFSSDHIRKIIAGDDLLFPTLGSNIVEEVFAPKRPKIIHKYLFGDLIGEGSYAKVKEVVEEDTLVRRAVKIIQGKRVRKFPNGLENVNREIRILRKVNHPNVIRLVEVFKNEAKMKLYMVLEFCMGSVQQLIDSSSEKRLEEREAHSYFCGLITGLEYLHSIGIVHKDIKPGNLLLSPDFTLKISDFGVAEELSMFQADDRCQLVQGTPKFQAPELVSGTTNSFSGFKADVWSSGVTLYNMISGLYPFEGEVIMRLFDNIAKQPLEMPKNVEIGDYMERLLRGMLEKDADKRYGTKEIKRSEWFQKSSSKDSDHSPFPNSKKGSVYRPLTVTNALEQLYPVPDDRIRTDADLSMALSPTESVNPLRPFASSSQPQSPADRVAPSSVPRAESSQMVRQHEHHEEDRPRRNRSFFGCFMPS